jgi:serine/threonine-protein kinase ATR
MPRRALTGEIGRSWLASAKIARKAGQWQTAYCSMLQAQQTNERFSFMESAKLVKATGEPLRALQELENSMSLLGLIENRAGIIDLTDDDERKKMEAKVGHLIRGISINQTMIQARVLRARWMNESDRFEASHILQTFQIATELCPKCVYPLSVINLSLV